MRNLVNRLLGRRGQSNVEGVAELSRMLGGAGPTTLSACTHVVAVAVIHSRPNKTGHDARRWATEFVKQYKVPGWIPDGLRITDDTPVEMTVMSDLPRREVSAIHRALAEMLAATAPGADPGDCSAIAFSGDNPALGHTQFSILAK